MSIDVGPQTEMKQPPSPWRWLAAVLAAAVVLVAVVASFGVFGTDDNTAGDPVASPSAVATVTETAPVPSGSPAAGGDAATELSVVADAARCIPPTAKWLARNAALAFEGTVESVDAGAEGGEAVLRVDTWTYADGVGGTDTVKIKLPAPSTIPMPEFEKGKTYLVAAKGDSKVLGCGYSDLKSVKLQELYTAAFK